MDLPHLTLSSPYSVSVNSLPFGGKHSLSVENADILLEMDGGMKGELYLQIKVERKRSSGEILFGRGCGHSSNIFEKIKVLHPPKKTNNKLDVLNMKRKNRALRH